MRKFTIGRAQGGIVAISTSTAASQAITLVAAPILSRLYSPAAYGSFASLLALVMIASTAGSLRLDLAIPIAKSGDERSLVAATVWSSLLAGIVCAALLSVAGHEAISSNPLPWSLLIVYLVWVTTMYTVLTAHALRFHRYTAIAKRNLLQTSGMVGGQLMFSTWLRSALGLTAGLAVGRSLGVVSLIGQSQLFAERDRKDALGLSIAFRRYWRFPVVFMPSALLNVLGSQLPILLVARAYGSGSAGNLAQALIFGAIPAILIGTAVSSVVMAEMAAGVRAGELDQRARYMRVSKSLLPIGLVWLLLLVLVGRTMLPIVLGPEWSESGQYLAALAVAAATGLVASPVSVIFVLYERALANILLDIGRVVMVGGLGFASWKLGYGPVETVFMMSLGLAAIYVTTWLLGLRIISTGSAVGTLR